MNLPNKITTFRMACVFVIVFLLLFPWAQCGIVMPEIFNGVSLEYFISFFNNIGHKKVFTLNLK